MRSGDTVLHRPSGERWLVAYVDGDHLSWYGWPEGLASVADCELVKACSDEAHEASLREWANDHRRDNGADDHRSLTCRRQLAEWLASRGEAVSS